MKQIYPSYYPNFKCTASACGDNCCIGWEIDIDTDTLARYQAQPGAFGRRLREDISLEGTPHFLLKGERCPFLNEKNLCDIYTNMGEDALCEICTQHPRFHEWFGEVKESGVGLCCEAAARLIVGSEEPAAFIAAEIDEEPSEELEDQGLFRALCGARELIWSLLQDRSRSIWERLAAALRFACVLQEGMDGAFSGEEVGDLVERCRADRDILYQKAAWEPGETDCVAEEESLSQILSFLLEMEPIDESWPRELERIREDLPSLLRERRSFLTEYQPRVYEYEHIAVYFVYRYFLKAVYSGDVLSKMTLAAVSILVLSLVDTMCWRERGAFTLEDRVRIAKNYSKEMEYCEENLLRFREACWEEAFLAPESLLILLEKLDGR